MIIEPIKSVSGELQAPSSKSYTHRVLFLGLLADGVVTFENPLKCDDTKYTLQAVREFGAEGGWERIENDGKIKRADIYAGESGTTARIATGMASIAEGRCRIDGDHGLRERPMSPLLEALEKLNVKTKSIDGTLPVEIEGKPSGNYVEISGEVSSQFITALLYLGSRMGLDIKITDKLVSEPYVDMSIEVLERSGVKIERKDNIFHVEGDIKLTHFSIPGDYSSAAFFLAAGALFGDITVKNLQKDSVQADRIIIDLLERFGADVIIKEDQVRVEKNELYGIECDCRGYPDLFPILTVLGSYSKGETVLIGEQLRYKESDRIENMVTNLKKMGADIDELEDGITVRESNLEGAELDPRGDHRIAMALAIAALGAEGTSDIKQSKCVKKSYPDFFEDLEKVIDYGR